MLVVVVMDEGFYKQGHEASGEKHSDCIFEGKGELLISFVVVMLQVSEVVQDGAHHEFVEEDDNDEGHPGNGCGSHDIAMTGALIFLCLRSKQSSFPLRDEVKDY